MTGRAGGQDSDGGAAQAPMRSRCSSGHMHGIPGQRGRQIPRKGNPRRLSTIESDPSPGLPDSILTVDNVRSGHRGDVPFERVVRDELEGSHGDRPAVIDGHGHCGGYTTLGGSTQRRPGSPTASPTVASSAPSTLVLPVRMMESAQLRPSVRLGTPTRTATGAPGSIAALQCRSPTGSVPVITPDAPKRPLSGADRSARALGSAAIELGAQTHPKRCRHGIRRVGEFIESPRL